MKILYVATVRSHIGQFHMPVIRQLVEDGHEVHAAFHDNSADKKGLDLSVIPQTFEIPFERSPYSMKNIAAYKALKKVIREGHYDIIHCHTPVGAMLTRLAARKERKHGTKVFYTAHGFHFYKGASKKNWLLFYPVEKFLARYTDVLITIIMMLSIVAHHYVVNSGLLEEIAQTPFGFKSVVLLVFGAWGKVGINGFVLITGYYMCKSRITAKKYLKLLAEIIRLSDMR